MAGEYITVSKEATILFEEKKSKFIAHVKPVSSEEEALAFLNGIRKKHWDATHNVYAYDILGEHLIQRFSDDGEPQGTAGLPVMEVLKKNDLHNVIVVVTRYFGGTMLGSAGLIRAYGKSAGLGVEAAGVLKQVLCQRIHVGSDYELSGKLQNLFAKSGYQVEETLYTQEVEFILRIPVVDVATFAKEVEEASFGRAKMTVEEGDCTLSNP